VLNAIRKEPNKQTYQDGDQL